MVSIWLWLFNTTITTAQAQDAIQDERLIKAAFIYNFAKFTRWPETVWQSDNSPLLLCTVGDDELTATLQQLTGKTIQSRPVIIQAVNSANTVAPCHVLYVSTSEINRYGDLVGSIQSRPILTISELPDFGRSGGIIELFREKSRIRFMINLDTARQSGLDFSSRLLYMAVPIGQETAP